MYTMFALKIERVQCGITIVHRMCLPNGTTYWRVNRALWLFWNCYSFGWWDCRITDTRRVFIDLCWLQCFKRSYVRNSLLLSGMAGAMLGITLSYILGLKLGLPVLKKYGPKIRIKEHHIEKHIFYLKNMGHFF